MYTYINRRYTYNNSTTYYSKNLSYLRNLLHIFLFKVVSVIKNCILKSDVYLFTVMIQILVQWHMIVVNCYTSS